MSLAAFKAAQAVVEALRKHLFTADIYGDFNDKDERDEREPDGIVIYRPSISEHDPEMSVCAEDLELLIEYCASFEYKTFAIYKDGKRIGTGRSEVDSNGINPRFEYDSDYKGN
jgi:hypothetical protein